MKIGLRGEGLDWRMVHVVDQDGNEVVGVRRVTYDVAVGDAPLLALEIMDTATVEVRDLEVGEIEWAGRRWREVVS